MKNTRTLVIALAAAWLPSSGALAQGSSSTSTNQPVFRVRFSATCQSVDATKGRIATTRLTERNIIAQALGTSPGDRNTLRNFALAYNAAEDSLQVVNSNLLPVLDVVHFGGGVAIAANRQLDRFTFLFFPGQTNEFGAETNVFGSAVITERANPLTTAGSQPMITGKLQFFLTDGNVLGAPNPFTAFDNTNTVGMSNSVSGTNGLGLLTLTNSSGFASTGLSGEGFVMTNSNIVFATNTTICIGTFSTFGRLVPFPSAPTTGSGTNGVGVTNNITATNTTTGVGGTNGTGQNGMTNTGTGTAGALPGTVPGFNTGTATTVGSGTATIGSTATGSTAGTTGVSGTTGLGTVGATTATGGPVGTGGTGTPTGSAGATVGTTAMPNTSPAGTAGSTTFVK